MEKKKYIKCYLEVLDIEAEAEILAGSMGYINEVTDGEQLAPEEFSILVDDMNVYEK